MNVTGVIKASLDALFVILCMMFLKYPIELEIKMIILYVFLQVVAGRYQGKALLLYDEIRMVLIACFSFFVCSFLITPAFFINEQHVLIVFLISVFGFCVSMLVARYTNRFLYPYIKYNVLIVGIGDTAQALSNVCRGNRYSLLDVKCYCNCNESKYFSDCQDVIVEDHPIYRIEDIEEVIDKKNIDTVLIAIPRMDNVQVKKLVKRLSYKVKVIKYLPQVPNTINFDTKIQDFDGLLMISSSSGTIRWLSQCFKRLVDIFASLFGILLLIPLTLFVRYKNHKQGDTGPIFFTQERIGKDGKIFKIYKYRTMVENAEQVLEDLMNKNPVIRKEYEENKKIINDPRITEAGKFLRKTSIDEFPQFINVLLGQMSLIGPRPYLPREKKDMGDSYDSIIACRPGLTGMWQTHGRSDVSFKYRLELDEYYHQNWTFWLDVTLFFKTIRQVIYGNGAM